MVQKVHSEILPHSSYYYYSHYSLKFKNRINSCNTPITRNTNCSINQYNPYWMLFSDTDNDINKEKKLSFINIHAIEKGKYDSENNNSNNDFSKINENEEMKIYTKEKNINVHSNMNTIQSSLNYSSFDDIKNDSTTLNKLKSIFSLFYKNNKKNNSKRTDIETNNKYVKNEKNTGSNDKCSKLGNIKSVNDSSLISTSNVRFSSNSGVDLYSKHANSYLKSMNQSDNKIKLEYRNKNLNQNNQLNNNLKSNINLTFKNLFQRRTMSQKFPSKNIEYLKSYKRQIRRKSNELSIHGSNNKYPNTLYSFKQINEYFPKKFRKMTISLDNQNLEIKRFKDNTYINKHFKNIKRKLEKFHHKKNATTMDYILTIECLNTILTDENTIKSIKKSSELIDNIENKNSINRSLNNNKNGNKSDIDNRSFIINTYNNYPRDAIENDTNQFISSNEANPHYERNIINENIDSYYTFEDVMNMNKDTDELEKQKQDLQQQLIQRIQQQNHYYQENKIDYSYSCTTLSSFTSDESYSVYSEDDYEFPYKTKNYYETFIVSSNPMSSITSLSFKKNKDNSVSITASYSTIANKDLKKLNILYNNNNNNNNNSSNNNNNNNNNILFL